MDLVARAECLEIELHGATGRCVVIDRGDVSDARHGIRKSLDAECMSTAVHADICSVSCGVVARTDFLQVVIVRIIKVRIGEWHISKLRIRVV